ncbi:MAG: calcium/sodium antiporter [Phycisphaerae bacterium]
MPADGVGLDVLLIVVSVGVLYAGAELLVRGAGRLAIAMRIRPLVVGLTVVAFATSAPELVVGLTATLRNVSDIAVGNIIGANIANVGLIIGLSALIRPLRVHKHLWRKEVPATILVQVLLWAFCLNGTLGRWEGLALVAVLVAFLAWMIRTAKDREATPLPDEIQGKPRRALNVVQVVAGVALLVAGGNLLVHAAVGVAEAAGLSRLAIGLTIVAMGTTVPELATSVVAARRGEGDIAVGNAVGSVFFNTACILGLASAIRPITISWDVYWVKLPVMIVLVLALVPFMRSGFRVARWEGAVLLACYIAFVVYSFWSGLNP